MNAEGTGACKGLGGRNHAAQGFSLIELLIAITVLAIGMAGLALLFTTAAMGNDRAKGDTSGTMLAQTVLEKIAAQPANNANPVTMVDCNPNGATTWSLTTAAGGAPLDGNGSVDFAQAAVPNYSMQYVSCGSGGRQMIYDVRWNVQAVSGNTRIITVSARAAAMAGNASANQALLFAVPITLRTVGGI